MNNRGSLFDTAVPTFPKGDIFITYDKNDPQYDLRDFKHKKYDGRPLGYRPIKYNDSVVGYECIHDNVVFEAPKLTEVVSARVLSMQVILRQMAKDLNNIMSQP